MPQWAHLQGAHRVGELGVAAAPVTDHARAGETEAFGDLGGPDEIIGVEEAPHGWRP
jgi:hypothetical protein